ncbi:hypothetical protein ACLOJK_007464 [Asimina triloba]
MADLGRVMELPWPDLDSCPPISPLKEKKKPGLVAGLQRRGCQRRQVSADSGEDEDVSAYCLDGLDSSCRCWCFTRIGLADRTLVGKSTAAAMATALGVDDGTLML